MNLLFQNMKEKTSFIILLTCLFFMPQLTKAQYTINTVHANLSDCDTMTRGIFIIWWDKDFNYSAQADEMLDSMLTFRDICLNDLGMQDPLSALDGFYCNIYFHTPGNSADFFFTNFPEWGNGVGGDSNGYPFMTLPNFVLGDWRNLAHETFHIFQSHGMWDVTPGIYLTDDGGWYVEAMASWFAYFRYPNSITSFIESEILVRLPHVPIWLGWANRPSYYPNNWQRQVHQYALSTYFYYLTNNAGILESDLVSVFYCGTSLSPQEYLFNQIGGAAFRNHFIDCAAHMTNNFDFLQPSQAARAQDEWDTYADPLDDNQFLQTYTDTGSDGWFRPADSLTTNAWSFNTYKLLNTKTETYTFEINGDVMGTYGDYSFFQGKVLVQNSVSGARFYNLVMSNTYQGTLSLNFTSSDTAIYFIIASMPEIFQDSNLRFQQFPYEMRINTGSIIGIAEIGIPTTKFEIARYDIWGQRIDQNVGGLQFILYNDGSTKKYFSQK